MKKIISWVLLISIICQLIGCYSFREVELDDNSFSSENKIENKEIKITLNSGKQLISKAYNHTYNDEAGDLILGQGTIYSPENGTSEIFSGKILKNDIDSMKFKNNFVMLWLKSKDVIKFEKTKYLEVNGDSSKGLLLTDEMKLNIVPLGNIKSIEANEYNSTLSTITIVGVAVVTIGLLVILFGKPSFNGPILGNRRL